MVRIIRYLTTPNQNLELYVPPGIHRITFRRNFHMEQEIELIWNFIFITSTCYQYFDSEWVLLYHRRL